MNLRINCFYVRKCVLLNSLLYLYITRHLFGLIKCIHNNLFLSPHLFGITDSFAFTTLAVPKSCYSLGARTTFDRGASFCSLLPALQALATSLRMTYRFVIAKPCKRLRQSVPLSLRGCGCPVDTSAKQKHRPSRQARRVSPAAIRFPPKGYLRILSRSALRMTNHFVIAKPCKRLWQSVFPLKGIYGFFHAMRSE